MAYFDWIYVLNPIRFVSVRRNEVASKISGRNVRQAAQGGGQPLYLATPQEIVQRASLLLQDVHDVIEAHFDMTDKAAPLTTPASSRILSSAGWNGDSVIIHHTSVAVNFPLISSDGRADRSRPLMKAVIWV